MDSRRDISRTRRRSPPRARRSHNGTMTWLEIMVESAIAATITIEVAAENPPRKARSAMSPRPAESGTVRTKRSGLAPSPWVASPAAAIGRTKSDMSAR